MTSPPAPLPAIEASGLVKTYSGGIRALDGLTFAVPAGTVFGMLGPNGAGKSTAVKILTTLSKADAGQARVAGIDVARHPDRVRLAIGYVAQKSGTDREATGRENLLLQGRFFGLGGRALKGRVAEMLERFGLAGAADRVASGYSGGMQRRLDLAASLVGRPRVLFLDEPTTGLDPRARLGMWDIIRSLVAGGTTLLLTTQYLDEADELADEIVVIDHGLVIAAGTSEELKNRVGGDVIEFTVPDRSRAADAIAAIKPIGEGEPHADSETGVVSVGVGARGSDALIEAVRALDAAGVASHGLALRRPSLDDVFLALTGHAAEDEQPNERRRRPRGRGRAEDPRRGDPESRSSRDDTAKAAS